jgi:hypothetical protein
MSNESDGKDRMRALLGHDIQVPFSYSVIDGEDPSRRSREITAKTRQLSLNGLIFDTEEMDVGDGFHLSFADSGRGRNFMEIIIQLGRQFSDIEVLGQVEWYEKRTTAREQSFIVRVDFVDVSADALAMLREFLHQYHRLSR